MAACQSPFTKINDKTGTRDTFPCGKCYECHQRRISGWSFRLMKESTVSHSAFFITLTYNTDNVPITPKGFMNLDKREMQLFIKRLRKIHPKNLPKIKYYLCGEYGTKSDRPHYHAIIFNARIQDIEQAWTRNQKPIGAIHVGDASEASAGYTLKYMSKAGKIPKHANDDRQPEFAHMSKGLGANYLSPQTIKWHKADMLNRMYVPLVDGKKIAMPRYYKQKIYSDYQRRKIGEHMQTTQDAEYQAKTEQEKQYDQDVIIEKARKHKKGDQRNTKI